MNIAYVSNVVYPFVKGGAERRIYEIGSRLAADHEITIYGRHFWDGPKKATYHDMNLYGVDAPRDLYTGDRRSIVEAIEFAMNLLNPLRRHIDEHDVVVASVFPYFPVITSELSSLFKEVPLITTWHEVWDEYWEEYLGALSPFGKATERFVTKLPQDPVAVSELTADRLARLGMDRNSINIVPNGINIERIQSITPVDMGFDVLFAGRLISEKNLDLVLHAFDRVADSQSSLGIIGDGPELDRLRTYADSLDSSDRISFLGFLDDYKEVIAHMQAASVFMSPSVREGFGLTLLEAMAAGCTVIAADAPRSAADEVVGEAGFVAPPNKEALSTALKQALNGDELQSDPRAVAARYDWEVIATQAVNVYRNALK